MAPISSDIPILRTRFARSDRGWQLEFARESLGVPTKYGIVAEGGDDVIARLDEENLGENGNLEKGGSR